MNHDNSSPALTEQQLPKDDGGPHQKSSDVAANSSALMEKWGCTLDELYRIAVKFFKGNYVCSSFIVLHFIPLKNYLTSPSGKLFSMLISLSTLVCSK